MPARLANTDHGNGDVGNERQGQKYEQDILELAGNPWRKDKKRAEYSDTDKAHPGVPVMLSLGAEAAHKQPVAQDQQPKDNKINDAEFIFKLHKA